MVKVKINNEDFYVDRKLIALWERHSLENIKKQNRDRFTIVDGKERSGKSTWTIQQAAVLDKEMFSSPEKMVSRICFSSKEFMEVIRQVKNGVVIFDEAFRGLSSRAAMSKVNKLINQILMEVGQNNNHVFIVLPSYFLLDIYAAMLRSDNLFNIKLNANSGRRIWRGWNYEDKNIIYQIGIRKGWRYPIKTKFKGLFFGKFPGGKEYEKAYLAKKAKSLAEIDKLEEEKPMMLTHKWKEQRDFLIYLLKQSGKTQKWVSEQLTAFAVPLSEDEITLIMRKMLEKHEKHD